MFDEHQHMSSRLPPRVCSSRVVRSAFVLARESDRSTVCRQLTENALPEPTRSAVGADERQLRSRALKACVGRRPGALDHIGQAVRRSINDSAALPIVHSPLKLPQTLDLCPAACDALTDGCSAFGGIALIADHNFCRGARMIRQALKSVAVFGCLTAGASVQAHHSTAAVYDPSKEGEVRGALAKIQFVNPHGSLTVSVKNDDGTTTDWTFTTGSATALAARGITKVGPKALKVGEELIVTFTPARNGSPLGGLKTLKRANGEILGNAPGDN